MSSSEICYVLTQGKDMVEAAGRRIWLQSVFKDRIPIMKMSELMSQ